MWGIYPGKERVMVLSRCQCAKCELAEMETRAIARRYGAAVQINKVPMDDCCGSAMTCPRPVFTLGGKAVTSGMVDRATWEKAFREMFADELKGAGAA